MTFKIEKINKSLKVWRKASCKFKQVARKKYNHILRYVEENEHLLDDKTKEKVAVILCKYKFCYIQI